IRDRTVTGVQTCALPICVAAARRRRPTVCNSDKVGIEQNNLSAEPKLVEASGIGDSGGNRRLQVSRYHLDRVEHQRNIVGIAIVDRKSTRLNSSHRTISY